MGIYTWYCLEDNDMEIFFHGVSRAGNHFQNIFEPFWIGFSMSQENLYNFSFYVAQSFLDLFWWSLAKKIMFWHPPLVTFLGVFSVHFREPSNIFVWVFWGLWLAVLKLSNTSRHSWNWGQHDEHITMLLRHFQIKWTIFQLCSFKLGII